MNPIEIIAEASAKMAEIHKQAAEAQKALLLNLHVKCGFSSKEDFITAFNAANGTQPAPRKQEKKPGPKPAAKPAAAKPAAAKKETATPQAAPNKPAKRKKHKRISEEIKKQVRQLAASGTPAKKIAGQYGISIQSVHNIKKEKAEAKPAA